MFSVMLKLHLGACKKGIFTPVLRNVHLAACKQGIVTAVDPVVKVKVQPQWLRLVENGAEAQSTAW